MKREFSSLSAQEALHVAIFVEERNANIYQQFAEMFAEFRDPESLQIAGTFWDLAGEERHHGTILQEAYQTRYGNRACAMTEEDILEAIEMPQVLSGDIFAIARSNSSRQPRQLAFEIALAAEQTATRFYTKLVANTKDPELLSLYREFLAFEDGHTDFLEAKLREAKRATSGTEMA